VSSTAVSNLDHRKYDKIVDLPQATDLQKLSTYLTQNLLQITEVNDASGMKAAQELLMIRLLTFNKRRPMEVEAIRYCTFH
jgi:hypothetical protein